MPSDQRQHRSDKDASEMNNLLMVIHLNAELIERISRDDRVRAATLVIRESVTKAKDVVARMRGRGERPGDT
ncbi:MAG TPA: hypothetical protein VMT00_09770 [Thermoanaerobaculia bacterium]|nr:hypothetical protein [Thermoanaerobaculia bacterium]